MKKPNLAYNAAGTNGLFLRAETIRILTKRELILVAAGNCLNGSAITQSPTTLAGIC